jgi:hypothetical protein
MIVAIIDQTNPVGVVNVTWISVQEPAQGMRWAYDFGSPGLVQVNNRNVIQVCAVLAFDAGADIIVTNDGSWEILRRFVIAPDAICGPDLSRFIIRPRFAYRSTGGAPKLRITENGNAFGNEKSLTDETGWTRDKFNAGQTPLGGMNTYELQGDRVGATEFELRGLVIELAQRVD